MRDYKFDIPTIDSMELSTLIHTIPSNDNDSRHINTNNSKHQNNIEQIYQINASKLSKRARVIHRNTINIFNTNHNVIETKTIDKLLNFMNIANAPYCIQSLLQYFGSKNGISKELLENMLIKLVKSNCLQSKQFENGSTLYWITQNDIKYNKQITVTENELQDKISMLSRLRKERYKLELENKKIEYEKYFTIWTHRKAKTFEMIETLFETFQKSPLEILTHQIHGETDIDNNIEFEQYEFLFKQTHNIQ
eukprot:424906_1